MLPNHQYLIPQREPLIGIIRDRCIHRSMSNRGASRRRDHPPNMLIRLVPHLDPKGEVAPRGRDDGRAISVNIDTVRAALSAKARYSGGLDLILLDRATPSAQLSNRR